jgi:hypothetical protein
MKSLKTLETNMGGDKTKEGGGGRNKNQNKDHVLVTRYEEERRSHGQRSETRSLHQ